MIFIRKTRWGLTAGFALTMLLLGIRFEAHQGQLIYGQWASAQARKALGAQPLPRYVPPQFSAPTGRMGGGTRGQGSPTLNVVALAPDHVGLTLKNQPSLYWYLSQGTSRPVEFTMSARRAVTPLVETRLPSPATPGIQRVQLAEYDVRLAPGVAYRWFVSVIDESGQRSRDVVASGVIQRQPAPEGFLARLSGAEPSRKPHVYAEAGFWYDAVLAISELIDASPQNLGLRRQRAALMEQVGLREAAAYDRQSN